MSGTAHSAQIRAALAAYALEPLRLRPLAAGLINKTYQVTTASGHHYILQAVNAMFPVEVNLDTDVVTRHLERSGLRTPRLQQNRWGELYYRHDNQLWRLFNHIDGNTHERLRQPALAAAAGALLGRMHRACERLEYQLRAPKPKLHDTPLHVQQLQQTLATRGAHGSYARLKPLGEAILERLRQTPALPDTAPRLLHGDPKIANFIFSTDDREALCMVDFDTLNRAPVYLELGDALRSWCNPCGEDHAHSYFSMAHCRAALAGYARHAKTLLTPAEWRALPAATLVICLELAARFCADALNEDYFSWDPQRFTSHSEHSETRAKSQFNMAGSLLEQYDEMTAMVIKTADL